MLEHIFFISANGTSDLFNNAEHEFRANATAIVAIDDAGIRLEVQNRKNKLFLLSPCLFSKLEMFKVICE